MNDDNDKWNILCNSATFHLAALPGMQASECYWYRPFVSYLHVVTDNGHLMRDGTAGGTQQSLMRCDDR